MKKSLLWLAVVLLCVSMIAGFSLAGCKSTTTSTTAAAETTAAATAAETTTTAVAETTTAGKNITINVSYMKSGTYDVAAKDVAEQLKSQGIDVNIDAFPWAVLRQNNITDIVSGNFKYDVMCGGYYLADIYSHFTPLKPYIDKSNYGKGFIDGAMDNWCETLGGNLIGVPYGADAYGIMYRTDLFQQADIQLPTSWDEFYKALALLKTKLPADVSPYVFAAGAPEQLPALILPRYTGSYISKDGHFQLESDKFIAATIEVLAMLKQGPSNINALSIDQANAMFLQGKAAVIEGWPSFVTGVINDPSKSEIVGKWGLMPYPEGGFTWLSAWNMFMPKESKNPDAAWKWMETYTNEKNAADFFVKYGIGSCYTSSYENEDVVKKYGEDFLKGQLQNLKMAKNPPLSGEAQDFIAKILGDIYTGKVTPENGTKQINDKLTTITVPQAILESAKKQGLQAQ